MSPPDAPAEKRHWILSLARPEAYVPMSRAILGRIGYAILPREDWQADPTLAERSPELCIVEDRQLGEIPESFASTPRIVVSSKRGPAIDDRRVVGVVARPAGLHELYRLFQQALEPVARGTLRVLTNLPVRLRSEGREWQASLLSLSQNGGLVRSSQPLELGAALDVAFELPRAGRIETRAEVSYHLLPDVGLVFQATPPAARRAILGFVEAMLAA
jgi:PilZ domain